MHQASFFDSEPQQPVQDAEGGLRYLPGVFDPQWCERLFEILLTQSQQVDPEAVLSAAFITADVGKLYLILAKSLGRAVEH